MLTHLEKQRSIIKTALIIFAVICLSSVLVGCAKTISGDVMTVIEEAKDLSTDDKANAEVSGYLAYGLSAKANDSQFLLLR